MVIAGGRQPARRRPHREPLASTEPAMVIAGGTGVASTGLRWRTLQRSRRW